MISQEALTLERMDTDRKYEEARRRVLEDPDLRDYEWIIFYNSWRKWPKFWEEHLEWVMSAPKEVILEWASSPWDNSV